jgi:hypothetical protein
MWRDVEGSRAPVSAEKSRNADPGVGVTGEAFGEAFSASMAASRDHAMQPEITPPAGSRGSLHSLPVTLA